MSAKLSDTHVAQFIWAMSNWQQRLNLLDWRIEYSAARPPRGVMADVDIDPVAQLATYRVGRNWGSTQPTEANISTCALHEALHVMLHPLCAAAASKDTERTAQIEHSIITILERVIHA